VSGIRLDIAAEYLPLLLRGAMITLVVTLVVQVAALIIGIAAALAKTSKSRLLVIVASAYTDFFRGTPLLVQLYWVFFALPVIVGRDVPSAYAAVGALSLHMGAYTVEIVRAGILSVHKGQMQAARGLGMSYGLAMRRIILPPALRTMIPELISNFVQILKATSVVSVLGFPDLMYQANQASAFSYRPLEIYTLAAILYFLIAFPISIAARGYERRTPGDAL
jgi:polar amino acid transport system permease protein